jgi:hypothetical protein
MTAGILAFGLGACGTSTGPDASATVDPCTLVTLAEASQLTGKTLTETYDFSDIGFCEWGVDSSAAVAVLVFQPATHEGFIAAMATMDSVAPVTWQTVSGVGDEARAGTQVNPDDPSTRMSFIYARKGNVVFEIAPKSMVSIAALTAQAKISAGRIP